MHHSPLATLLTAPRLRRGLGALVTALLAAPLAGAAGLPSASAADARGVPVVDVRPQQLERGVDQRLPHLDGRFLVIGGQRVRLVGDQRVLVGHAGDGEDTLAVVATRRDGTWRTLRVDADGRRRLLLEDVQPGTLRLVEGGSALLRERTRKGATQLTMFATRTGDRLARRSVDGLPSVTGADRTRVLLADWSGERTLLWRWREGRRVTTLLDEIAYRVSFEAGRVATFTGDPYLDGCSVVRPLDDLARTRWRSCQERVESFSPDGSRLLTVHILSDGMGPTEVDLRTGRGRHLLTYDVGYGWIWTLGWEGDRTFVADVDGRRKAATVRCHGASCARASDLEPTAAS
ncbi:hypothetical protein [Nocardioides bruguierae]|uniref:Uncharacterized protein n=1 Tax=Nocardioides bruguierae TaxID=2945102 RepID=A0A9X2D5C5_9ACTN|nr:hypothetical protein [Nocardioides bruguierae]MCL8027112.1 hypothetical protein [Nocardioides bruguierae]MCM0619603.1 hypothetical protein [Nocardioides bruguierae]